MNKLIIGNKNYSSWSLRAWLALKHAGIEFEEELIPLFESNFKEKITEFSHAGKVPILITDNTTIWDSMAICDYAAETNSELMPTDQAKRFLVKSICQEMHSGFELIRSSMPMNCRAINRQIAVTEPLQSEINRIEAIWTQCLITNSNSSNCLFGKFTVADAMYAPIVFRFNSYGIHLNNRCNQYVKHVLSDKYLNHWLNDAISENYVIKNSEVGNSPEKGNENDI